MTVLDAATFAPLSGALVASPTCGQRMLSPEAESILGRTGELGSVELDLAAVQALASLSILARGHVPARLATALLADGEEMILLSGGDELMVECRDLQGAPLEGCTVFSSVRHLPSRADNDLFGAPGSMPGGVRARVHSAVSDASGIAAARGLEQGKYLFSGVKAGYTVASRSPKGGVDVPSLSSPVITFCRLYGTAVEVAEDEILASDVLYGSSDSSTAQWKDIEVEVGLLKRRFPGAAVGVFMLTDESVLTTPAKVQLLLRRRGAVSVEAKLQPLDDLREPRRVELPEPEAGAGCLPAVITIRSRSGEAGLDSLFTLQLKNGLMVFLKEGTMLLPEGSHPLICQDSRLQGTYAPLSCEVPGRTDIVVSLELRRCAFSVIDSESTAYSRYNMSIWSFGKTSICSVMDNSLYTVLLPAGPARINATVWGLPETETSVEVLPGEGIQTFTIALNDGP